MKMMRAAVLEQLNQPLVIREVPVPEIGPDEALVETWACGICGTDVHICEGLAYVPTLPHILGHETAGVVAGVGENVHGLASGQRVVAHDFFTCGQCYYCRVGRDTQCINVKGILGVTVHGGFAEYYKVPAANLFPLPDSISFAEGGLIADAVVTSLHAFRRARFGVNDTVAIIGAGGIGQYLIQLLRTAGVKVVASSRSAGKLALARTLGATLVLQADDPHAVQAIKDLSDGYGARCVFDCVGSAATMKASATYVMRGGQIIVIGEEPDFPAIDTIEIAQRELEIIGSRNGTRQDMADAIALMAQGVIKSHISHILPIQAINEGLELMRSGNAEARIVIALT